MRDLDDHLIHIKFKDDNIEGKYLKYLDTLVESGVVSIYCIQSLLMNKFPELGMSGAILIVEYWQAEISMEDE